MGKQYYALVNVVMSWLCHSGDGGWSIAGVTTVRINDSFVNCTSTHLTSFAVLVDVSGTRIVINLPKYCEFILLTLCILFRVELRAQLSL